MCWANLTCYGNMADNMPQPCLQEIQVVADLSLVAGLLETRGSQSNALLLVSRWDKWGGPHQKGHLV